MTDNRNVQDKYKEWMEDLVRDDLRKNSFPFAVLMEHLQGDFNIGGVVRSANAFGAMCVYYCGKKKWDRRGAVGTHNYTDVQYIDDIQASAKNLLHHFTFVALEQCEDSQPMDNFEWPDRPLIVIGEEGSGLTEEMLDLCTYKVEIPQYGSVRSLNAASAASIAMYDFVAGLIFCGICEKIISVKDPFYGVCDDRPEIPEGMGRCRACTHKIRKEALDAFVNYAEEERADRKAERKKNIADCDWQKKVQKWD